MATLGAYKTASNYVEVKLEYSYSRSADGTSYTVTGTPYFHRTNTGYTTSATVFSGLFVNGTRVATKSQYVSTSNSTWVSAGSMTYTKTGLSPTSDYTITVGFATCSEVANLATGKKATSYNVYPSSATYTSGSITLPKTITYTACGTPTDVKITTTNTGTFTISAKAGSNGTTNATSSVDLYYTIDGTNPTTSNYRETFNISATAGTTVSKTFTFAELSESAAASLFGTDLAATVKLVARTRGAAGSSYYSSVSSVASATFTWRGRPSIPVITHPTAAGISITNDNEFFVSWNPPQKLANNALTGYIVYLVNKQTGTTVDYGTTSATTNSYWFSTSSLTPGEYIIQLVACGHLNSATAVSDGVITILPTGNCLPTITYNFDDLNCAAKETNVFSFRGERRARTFLDVGAGNICRVYWDDPSQPYLKVSLYDIYVSVFSSSSDSYLLYNTTVSKPEFYLTSDILRNGLEMIKSENGATFDDLLTLNVHINASSPNGAWTGSMSGSISDIFTVIKASGTLMETGADGAIPKLTRAIAFAKNNKGTWQPVEEFFARGNNDEWIPSDVRYATLLTPNGDVVLDYNSIQPIMAP